MQTRQRKAYWRGVPVGLHVLSVVIAFNTLPLPSLQRPCLGTSPPQLNIRAHSHRLRAWVCYLSGPLLGLRAATAVDPRKRLTG